MNANEFLHKKDVAYMNRLSTSLDFDRIVSLMEEYAALRKTDVGGSLPLTDLEKRLDEVLDKETPETLNKWLEENRK